MVRDRGGRGARRGTAVRAGVGGAVDPPLHRTRVVTNDMLRNAAASGDWLMYGQQLLE